MSDFNLNGLSWNKPTVSWYYTGSKPVDGEASFHTEISEAFAKWDSVIDLDFQEATEQSAADIVLTLGAIDGPYGVVGVANSFRSGAHFANQSTITFDSTESWTYSSSASSYTLSDSGTSTTFYAVALHEIGHTLGLSHPTNPSVILSAKILPSVTDLTAADIAGARAIYGVESSQADLDIATALQLSSASVKKGTDVTIGYEIKNFGNEPTGASTLGIYLSTDSTISTSDTLLTTAAVNPLSANGSISDGLTIATNDIAPGNYFLGVVSDYNDLVFESNESNNASGGVNFTVTPPAVTSLTADQEGEIVKLYISYFNRAPEQDGLDFHKNAVLGDLNAGASFASGLAERADHFFDAAILQADFTGYSASQTSDDFVAKLYDNVLDRPGLGGEEPTDVEKKYWTDEIDAGSITRGAVVQRFLSDQDILVSHGTAEERDLATQAKALFENRTAVGIEFAKPEYSAGLTNVDAFNAGTAALALVTSDPASVAQAMATFVTLNSTSAATVDEVFSVTNMFDAGATSCICCMASDANTCFETVGVSSMTEVSIDA